MDLQDYEKILFLEKVSEEAFDFSNKKIEMFENHHGKISQQLREKFLIAGSIQYFYNLINESINSENESDLGDDHYDDDPYDDDHYDDDCDYDEEFSSNRDALEALLKALTK